MLLMGEGKCSYVLRRLVVLASTQWICTTEGKGGKEKAKMSELSELLLHEEAQATDHRPLSVDDYQSLVRVKQKRRDREVVLTRGGRRKGR